MGEPLPEGDFAEVLKNGVVLCKLMNKIQPECQEVQGEGSSLPPDGECPSVPGCSKEVRSPGRGSVPDPGLVRGPKHPPGGALPLLPWQGHPEAPRVHWPSHWTKDGGEE